MRILIILLCFLAPGLTFASHDYTEPTSTQKESRQAKPSNWSFSVKDLNTQFDINGPAILTLQSDKEKVYLIISRKKDGLFSIKIEQKGLKPSQKVEAPVSYQNDDLLHFFTPPPTF